MNERVVANIFDRANDSFERAGATRTKVALSTTRADNVLARIDQRSSPITYRTCELLGNRAPSTERGSAGLLTGEDVG